MKQPHAAGPARNRERNREFAAARLDPVAIDCVVSPGLGLEARLREELLGGIPACCPACLWKPWCEINREVTVE